LQLDSTISPTSFEEAYHVIREQEGRIYSNEELARLPKVAKDHPFYSEWKLRKRSAGRLKDYLAGKQSSIRILEAGCGNGWLSHQLALSGQCRVTGIDVHHSEIQQAAEVFHKQKNLEFREADFLSAKFPGEFDLIVFAASIQYFRSLPEVIERALSLLSGEGEIHIIDSHFYHSKDRSQAVLRSLDHFTKQKLPVMSRYYHHHCWEDLRDYQFNVLYSPNRLLNRLGMLQNPFPWIRIKK
jgi:SAM-dependent methyltransferase